MSSAGAACAAGTAGVTDAAYATDAAVLLSQAFPA